MKLNSIEIWSQATDLTFGEMRAVVQAAERAADDKLYEIRKHKIANAGKKTVAKEIAAASK